MDLIDFALKVFRQRLRRDHPDWTEAQIDARVEEWLAERPGAEFGDADGRVVPGWAP